MKSRRGCDFSKSDSREKGAVFYIILLTGGYLSQYS